MPNSLSAGKELSKKKFENIMQYQKNGKDEKSKCQNCVHYVRGLKHPLCLPGGVLSSTAALSSTKKSTSGLVTINKHSERTGVRKKAMPNDDTPKEKEREGREQASSLETFNCMTRYIRQLLRYSGLRSFQHD
jgi:hypothetical protein